jgi:hypothetical protein
MIGMPATMTGLGIARGALRAKGKYKNDDFERAAWKPRFLTERGGESGADTTITYFEGQGQGTSKKKVGEVD